MLGIDPRRWLKDRLAWRLANWRNWYRKRIIVPLSARSEALARRAHCPLPWNAPYRWPRLHLSRRGALGDVLMCTPALREIKRVNPRCRITFYTDYLQLLDGLACVDEVKPFEMRPKETIGLAYEHLLPPPRHIAQIMAEALGLRIRDHRPTCAIDWSLVAEYRAQLSLLPKPHIVVNRNPGPYTPNKSWPSAHWDKLVERLSSAATVIEIGTKMDSDSFTPIGNHISLAGKTNLQQMIALIAAADVLVSPIS